MRRSAKPARRTQHRASIIHSRTGPESEKMVQAIERLL
jgi:hypothetical protein